MMSEHDSNINTDDEIDVKLSDFEDEVLGLGR